MGNKILFKIILLCFISQGQLIFAQETKVIIPPLYKYLQSNADSSIVLTYEKDPIHPVRHFMLSKKSDIVTLYLYESPYNRKGKESIPTSIRNFFQKRDIEINNLQVDTNSFFNAKYINPKKAKLLWRKTMSLRPWQLTDDVIEGEGCKVTNQDIYDGGSISLYLITNDNIKRLYFYAPYFYEQKCPKEKKGRKAILDLEKTFKLFFERD